MTWKMSSEFPVFLFKHSTRCGISHQALDELINWYSNREKKVLVFFLDLIAHRPLSNTISSKSGVPHQSPQLICLVNGEAVNSMSHASIEESQINRFYNKVLPLAEGN
ncbi:MAG: bacillithiol system redox-active protein YtxJ [Saprospirales bacterium]|nr:MAG: bacillithiol system redox-active protein YtxJ [Saprospirales bacterium]